MLGSRKRFAPATALAVAATLVLAACGGSDNDSDSGSTTAASGDGGAASAGYTQAQADFKALQTPTGIDKVEPIGKPIPKGKKIDYVVCAPAACQPPATFTKQAAEKLGWSVKVINAGPTPETTKAAMAQTIRDEPDAVVYEGLDSSVFQAELKQLKAKGIPVVAWQTPEKDVLPNFFVIPGPSHYDLLTKAAAAATMVAGEGKPVVGHIAVPTFPIYSKTIDPKFNAALKQYCADCKVKTYDMPATSLGKDSATRIVNFLRANRDINVLVHDQDATALGLAPALKGASITGIQNVGIYPTTANLPNLADGSEFALLPDPYPEMGWLVIDALARTFTGQSPQSTIDITAPVVIWTKENVPEPIGNNLPPSQPGFESKFLEAWGLSK